MPIDRGNVAARLRQGRQKKSDQVECASGSSDAVCRRDGMSYGCIDWQPSELPQDETEESLLNKKSSAAEANGAAWPRRSHFQRT